MGILYNNVNEIPQMKDTDVVRNLSMENDLWSRFEGVFKNGIKEGIGYLHFHNGAVFLGEFKNDRANGIGVIECSNGEKQIGIWKENSLFKNI